MCYYKCHCVMLLYYVLYILSSMRASEQMVWSLKLNRNTAGILQEGHPEFKVLRCSSKKSGSKVSV